ncbi:uncharacterized protein [Tenebrio molitor]|uniref:Uncharacterized protein n=1 Tax=Tenebrio molitor TaxID=7067 RepID=A0A8J6HWU5_TENMO|nr:hypothetical protein GEV33_001079 [Tenebrio molitor]
MNRHNILAAKCLQLTIITAFVSARIVPSYYTSSSIKKNDETSNLGLTTSPQVENKWQFTNLDKKQTSELEKLVRQSLENIFKNEELSGDSLNDGNFGLKTTLPAKQGELDLSNLKEAHPDLDLDSPHIFKVPVPQPYPVHIPVKQPFTVPIFKLVPEEIEKKIPIPVEKLVPVYKEKPVKIIVEKHHPVHVYKPYPVPIPVNTHILLGGKNHHNHQNWY